MGGSRVRWTGAQAFQDVPAWLNQLRHVPVRIKLLTDLATKDVDLYKVAVANIGFTLGKYVVDQVLTDAASHVSNSFLMLPSLTSLDTFETFRSQCNGQKMAAMQRSRARSRTSRHSH